MLVVLEHGRLVHERAFGHARLYEIDPDAGAGPESDRLRRLARPEPMTSHHLFDLASLTKVLGTTSALMLLVDRGLMGLDDPVGRHLPAFAGGWRDSVTVRMLLTHTGGLDAWQPTYLHAAEPAGALAFIVSHPPAYPPGAERRYSDLGFILLGYLVERVAGRTLDRFIREEITTPLALPDASFRPLDQGFTEIATTSHGNPFERRMVLDTAFGYRVVGDPDAFDGWRAYTLTGEVNDGNAFHAHGGVAGHAGLFARARDAAALAQHFVEPRLVREETADTFLTPQFDGQALGWLVPRDLPPGSFEHTGFTGTYVVGVPACGLVAALLTNRQNVGVDRETRYPDVAPLRGAVVRALLPESGRYCSSSR